MSKLKLNDILNKHKTPTELRMEEILNKLKELDMYSVKYQGQEMLGILTEEQRAKWLSIEQEKQTLRDEYNTL